MAAKAQAAPAVQVRLGNARGERAIEAVLNALAWGAFLAWAVSHWRGGVMRWPHDALSVSVAALAAAGLATLLRPGVPERLAWDGERWLMDHAGYGLQDAVGELSVKIDMGFWMLLRWRCLQGRTAVWFGLRRGVAGAAWHGLRTAAFASGAGGGQR